MSDIAAKPLSSGWRFWRVATLTQRATAGTQVKLQGGLISSRLTPWLLPALLLALWQGASAGGFLSSEILPSPLDVVKAGATLIGNGQLADNLLVSARRAASGFLVGGALAFALGLSNGLSRLSERLTDTTVQMIRNIPNLSLIPLVIL